MVVYLSDLVAEAKTTLGYILVFVSGDFNQWPLDNLLEEHPDLREVDHGPTRQGRSIDRTLLKFPRAIIASGTSTLSLEFDGLESEGPPTGKDNVPLPLLTINKVATRPKLFKKPKGVIKGDIFPSLVTKHNELLAVPLTHIYNAISTTGSWPSEWKTVCYAHSQC